MNNISALDATIALSGYGAGLVVGCLNNVRKTGSLFAIPHDAPRDVSYIVKNLEVDRDQFGHQPVTGYLDLITPKLWHPFMPLEHLGPLTLLTITHIFIAAISPGATTTATAILGATYTFKIIVLPLALNVAVFVGGAFLRGKFEPYAHDMGIDPSGHAIAQSASAVYKFFALSALSSLNLSSNPFRVVAAITTLSDYLWTYRTASSYHSVMDMVVATIFMGISFGTILAGSAYAPGALRTLMTRIPMKLI